jgi:hypothetical protein
MRPHQWEPQPRPRTDWRLFAVMLAPWIALGVFDWLGI